MSRLSLRALGLALAVSIAAGGSAGAYPNSYAGELDALTEVQRLQTALQSRDSATETLRLWCADHHWAEPAQIRAVRDKAVDKPATPEVRNLLGAGAKTPVRYRRVKLMCGDKVLSEADNWYLPGKLTAEMNKALDESETPFGVVVKPLNFTRRAVDSRILVHPFDEPPEAPAPTKPGEIPQLPLPDTVIQNTAVLLAGDGAPFSVVVESYTRETLSPAASPGR
jgi:chorismate-pyruvate lyase